MKNLKWYDKLLFLINSVCAFVLLLSYLLPHVEPENFAIVSVLSLAVPLLILINLLFFLFWLLRVKKQMILSLLVLILGYQHLGSFYKFSGSKNDNNSDSISFLSYNVRLFNVYDWLDKDNVDQEIMNFISDQNCDVICLQEFHPTPNSHLAEFEYKHENLAGDKLEYGQVIWSKYPIIDKGIIKFENSANSAIYADIEVNSDTLRVYNVHLQSARIDAKKETLDRENSERLFKRAASTFEIQQRQAEMVVAHMESCKFPIVLAGDLNNTAFSYVYKILKGGKADAFVEAGNGFGSTYHFPYFPVRIDFILASEDFEVRHFKTYDLELSDHFPIKGKLGLRN